MRSEFRLKANVHGRTIYGAWATAEARTSELPRVRRPKPANRHRTSNNLSDGTFQCGKLNLAHGSNATATINQSGGEIISDETVLGFDGSAGGNATWNLLDGSLTTSARIRIGVGERGPRTHLFNQTGGTVAVTGRLDIGERVLNTCTYAISGGSLTTTGNVLCGAHNDGTGMFDLSGTAKATLDGLFVGNNATNTGTVSVSGKAEAVIRLFEVRNGSGTQEGEDSHVNATGRFHVGTAQTVTQTATYTLKEGGLKIDGDNRIGSGNAGDATLNIEGGIINTGNRLRVGIGAADGSLIRTNMVNQTGGVVNVTGGATPGNGRLDLGENPGSTNIYQISGGSATITMTGAPDTTYACRFSEDLATPFEPIVTDPATVTTDGNGDATFTVDAAAARRFYVVAEQEPE